MWLVCALNVAKQDSLCLIFNLSVFQHIHWSCIITISGTWFNISLMINSLIECLTFSEYYSLRHAHTANFFVHITSIALKFDLWLSGHFFGGSSLHLQMHLIIFCGKGVSALTLRCSVVGSSGATAKFKWYVWSEKVVIHWDVPCPSTEGVREGVIHV